VLGAAAALGGASGLLLAWPVAREGLPALLRVGLRAGAPPAWPEALGLLVRLSAAVGLGAAAAAALAGGLQVGLRFRLRGGLQRLAPLAGLRRILGRERLAELGWSTLRTAALALAAWLAARGALGAALLAASRGGARGAAAGLCALLGRAVAGLVAAHLLLALVDLGLERRRFHRRQRMTRQEVREEHREEEGDPAVRAERRRRHRQAACAPGLARASVLVVNPTHAAAALRYAPDEEPAPVLVATGVGEAARRLRAEAARLGLPVVRHVALARALQRLEPGELIPERLYQAAAEVLRAVEVALGRGAGAEVRGEERR